MAGNIKEAVKIALEIEERGPIHSLHRGAAKFLVVSYEVSFRHGDKPMCGRCCFGEK